MTWWVWVTAGLVLLVCEVFVPLDFYLCFIGVSGIITGSAVYFELLPETWIQWLFFSILALSLLASVRKKVLERIHSSGPEERVELLGEAVKVLVEIAPGQTGKGETRGSSWSIKNETARVLNAGESYKVSRREGLTLVIED